MKAYLDTVPGLGRMEVEFESGNGFQDAIEQMLNELPEGVRKHGYLSLRGGQSITEIQNNMQLRWNVRVLGGKGGFGSMLRAQGGKMRRKKGNREEDKDSFRTLDGRRLKSIRQAKELAKYLERKSELEKSAIDKKREKLNSVINAAEREHKTKFADTEFLEQSEELAKNIKENVEKHDSDQEKSPSVSSSSSSSAKPKGMDFFDSDSD